MARVGPQAAPLLAVLLVLLLVANTSALFFRKDQYGILAPAVRPLITDPHPNWGNKFDVELLGSRNVSELLWAGQEVRAVVRTAVLNSTAFKRLALSQEYDMNRTRFPGWNNSGPSNVRVRVIAAYSSRTASSGTPIQCSHGSLHDVWAESWSLSARVFGFGAQIIFAGYFTFTAPPFPFRLCIKDITPHNLTKQNPDRGLDTNWREFRNDERAFGRRVYRTREPLFLWTAGSSNSVGDFAAIKIFAHSNETTFNGVRFDPMQFSPMDSVKLVRAGFPCTYEKPYSHASRMQTLTPVAQRRQYCGANMVYPDGSWRDPNCALEGSVTEGIPHIGSTRQNPLAPASGRQPSDYVMSGYFPVGASLSAFLRLHAAGSFDICVSTRAYRINAFNSSLSLTDEGTYTRDARPIWFKAYNANSSTPCSNVSATARNIVATCVPRRTRLVVSAAFTDVTWTLSDRTHSTWAEMQFTASSGVLNFNPATLWDHSVPREYSQLFGGDQFRLVHLSRFPPANPNPQTAFGELYSDAAGNRLRVEVLERERIGTSARVVSLRNIIDATVNTGLLTDAAEGRFVQFQNGDPGLGTQLSAQYPGCFFSGDDNYGNGDKALNGNPGARCCSAVGGECEAAGFCQLSDSGIKGPTASADLGGNPRASTGQLFEQQPWLLNGNGTSSWAYLRVPAGGKWIVCYRREGGNWRIATPSSGGNTTFTPVPLHSGYTFHVNDTRALTYGPVEVISPRLEMTYRNWNYFTETLANPGGAVLKLVRQNENCQTAVSYPKTWSHTPGSLECPATPLPTGECLGSLDDGLTLRHRIYFYIRMPTYDTTTKFRVCFRRAGENWRQITSPTYRPHLHMNSPDLFHPTPEPRVEFTVTDITSDTWGKLIIRRRRGYESVTQPLDTRPAGDIVRILPNVSFVGDPYVRCDLAWGSGRYSSISATQKLQEFSNETVDLDLATYCTSASSSWCNTALRSPTVAGISAHFPYTDVVPTGDNTPILADDGAVAFFTLPPRIDATGRQMGYKICYKPRGMNWIEALDAASGIPFLTVKLPASVSISARSATLLSGSYAFFELNSTAYPIRWSVDVAKLVRNADRCDAPAVGTSGYNNDYVSIAGVSTTQHGRGVLVDATNVSQIQGSAGASGQTMLARVYLILPTVFSRTERVDEYRLCYMRRSSAADTTANWYDVTRSLPIRVRHLGVQYTITQAPIQFRHVTIQFLSGSRLFNTLPGVGDRAKVVSGEYSCSDDSVDVQPSIAPSVHEGLESDGTVAGQADLGPDDAFATRFATLRTVLPAITYLKVCYKPLDLPWFEVQQAAILDRIYHLPATGLTTLAPSVSSVALGAGLFAQTPSAARFAYSESQNFTSLVVGGASTISSGGGALLTVSLPSAPAISVADAFRFVRVAVETSRGVYQPSGYRSCDDGLDEVTVMSGTSSTVTIRTNLPTAAGKYIFCYRRNNSAVWHQPPATGSGTNPFTVVDSRLTFDADSDGSLTIRDVFGAQNVLGGALTGADRVYITNATGACGDEAAFTGASASSSAVNLNNTADSTNSSEALATRSTSPSTPPSIPTAAGAFAVCYYRSQHTHTQDGTAFAPFAKSGWYRLRNGGALWGARTDALIRTTAQSISFTGCPFSNATRPLRSGDLLRFFVRLVDGAGALVPLNGVAISVRTNGFVIENTRSMCSPAAAPFFGRSPQNLDEPSIQGAVNFRLAPLSLCPVNQNCSLWFEATVPGLPSVVRSTQRCSFFVAPTQVHIARVVSAPSRCEIDRDCWVRVAAFHADGGIAYASADAVAIYVQNANGLGVQAFVDNIQISTATSSVTRFTNGYVLVNLRFVSRDFNAMANTTRASVFFEANARNSTPITIEVLKPMLTAVHVIDVYPVEFGPISELPLQPSWEPAVASVPRVFRGGFSSVLNGAANVAAGPGYHLVAGQFYSVVLRAVAAVPGGSPRYVPTNRLMNSQLRITASIVGVNSTFNALIAPEGCVTPLECATPFVRTLFSQPSEVVTFRLRSAAGCSSRVSGGCQIRFQFDGADVGAGTSITTPVRGVARGLRLVSGATPSSTVNRGWNMTVEAIDADGLRDEFLDGSVFAMLIDAPSDVRLVVPSFSSSSLITQGNATVVRSVLSEGRSLLSFTLSRPCASCIVRIFSDGVAQVLEQNVAATANTHSLSCRLDTVLMKCATTGSDCTNVEGVTTTPTQGTMLYNDTVFCVSAVAVDEFGQPTEYERNWVSYQAIALSGESVIVTDAASNSEFRKRYKPMVASRAQFCITVASAASTSVDFDLHFQAQRFADAGYWATSRGRCVLGRFTLFPRKVVASLNIDSVTGLVTLPRAPGHFAGEQRSTTGSLLPTITFALRDHYGNRIEPWQLQSNQAFNLEILSNGGTPIVATSGSVALRGVIGVEVVSSTVLAASGPLQFTLNVTKYCIGCSVSFRLLDGAQPVAVRTRTSPTMAVAVAATVGIHVLNRAPGARRQLAFDATGNPLLHWVTGVHTSASPPVLHDTACWGTTCAPYRTSLLRARCDESGVADVITAAGGAPLIVRAMVVDEELALSGVYQSTASALSNVYTQLDIAGSVDVAATIGNQELHCVSPGAACTGSGSTAPMQRIAALGASLEDAVTAAIGLTDEQLPSARFAFEGARPSAFSALDASARLITPPTVFGALNIAPASPTSPYTSINTTAVLAWQGPLLASHLTVLDTASDVLICAPARFACHTPNNAGVCPETNGWPQSNTLRRIGFNYSAQHIPASTWFPISVDVVDSTGTRVTDANGTIGVTLESSFGCNDGGQISANDTTVINGRATMWVSFSRPCQSCSLRFTLTPDPLLAATVFARLRRSLYSLSAISRPITIINASALNATHVVLTTTAALQKELRVSDLVALGLKVRGSLGNLALDTTQAATAAVYNDIQTTARDWWRYGNGGILRRSLVSHNAARHMNAVELIGGSGTLTFAFTRTCEACRVTLMYRTEQGSVGHFGLHHTAGDGVFVVRTFVPTLNILTLTPPRVAKRETFAVTRIQAGSELSSSSPFPIRYAGVVDVSAQLAAYPNDVDFAALNSANGRGGYLLQETWIGDRTETHLLQFTEACDACEISIGEHTFTTAVVTKATHLRVVFNPFESAFSHLGVQQTRTYSLVAVDDDGAVDVLFGDTSCAFGALPFRCGVASNAVQARAGIFSVDPLTSQLTSSFHPQSSAMLSVGQTTAQISRGLFINGRATADVSFPDPIRFATLVFNAGGLISALRSDTTVPTITVSSPVSAVFFTAVKLSPGTQFAPFESVTFDLAAVVPIIGGTSSTGNVTVNQFVAARANNSVVVQFVDCPPLAGVADPASTTMRFALDRGYTRAAVAFSQVNPNVNRTCQFTFSLQRDGVAVCSSATVCETAFAINITNAQAQLFRVVRPTAIDNGGAGPGLLYGVPGRTTTLEVRLLSNSSGPATCATCTLSVVKQELLSEPYSSCNFRVDFIGTNRTRFDVNGTIVAAITWADSSAMYRCQVIVSVETGDPTHIVRDESGRSVVAFDVELRKPVRIAMLTNVSTDLPTTLTTGTPYAFRVALLDATGRVCHGDTQQDGTLLVLDVVSLAGTPIAAIQAFNLNLTTSNGFRQYVPARPEDAATALPPLTFARSVFGGFVFSVVFTNSTRRLGVVGGVRLRVSSLDGRVTAALSQPFHTVVASRALAFRAHAQLPANIMQGERVITCCNSSSTITVEATDALDAFGLRPNIASDTTEFGSDLELRVDIVPAFVSAFPFNVSNGSVTSARLAGGRYSWSGLVWTASEGIYALVISALRHPAIRVVSTFTVQAVRRLAIGTCTGNCMLPTFVPFVNLSVQPDPMMVSSSLQRIAVTVQVLDNRGELVVGDDQSVIMMAVQSSLRTTIAATAPPFFDTPPVQQVRVRRGTATFEFGLSGSTFDQLDLSQHVLAQINFFCPPQRPAALLHPGEPDARNPCGAAPQLTSRRLQLTDSRPDARVFGDPVVLLWKETVRFRLLPRITLVDRFDLTMFRLDLAAHLRSTGNYSYLSLENARRIINVQACAVTPFFSRAHDLSSSVCRGTPQACTGRFPIGCPPQVLTCLCSSAPAVAPRAQLLSRYLLQSGNNSSNGTNATFPPATQPPDLNGTVALEAFFELENAAGFVARRAFDVAFEYRSLQTALQGFLTRPDTVEKYGVDVQSISARQWNQGTFFATESPTMMPTAPPTPAPPQETPTQEPSGAAVGVSSTVLAVWLIVAVAAMSLV